MNTLGIILMNPLLNPAYGLIVWTLVAFLTVLFLLKKFAWKPILASLKEREDSIQEALDTAKKTKEEMALLKSDNERLINEAKLERDKILKEARDAKDAIINEAKTKAVTEGNRMTAMAREAIKNEKMAAITELRNQVAAMSIEIAEKILRNELADDEKQKSLMTNLLKEVNLN